MKALILIGVICAFGCLTGCGAGQERPEMVSIEPFFDKKTTVYGVDIFAPASVQDESMIHVAKVLAKYLDSNDDGVPNNPDVVESLKNHHTAIVMEKDANEMHELIQELDNVFSIERYIDVTEEEIATGNDREWKFDTALEEVLHLVTQYGYSEVYDELEEKAGSDIANAMDTARGGYYVNPPSTYPEHAWFTYDEEECEYNCQITEYFYWGITTNLGAQEDRLEDINKEWKLNTPENLQATDTALYSILTNADFSLPTVLPNGEYESREFIVEAIQ